MLTVAAQYASGNVPDSTRQRHHAPLYGRLVTEEHLPAVHRDIHQVASFATSPLIMWSNQNLFFPPLAFDKSYIIDRHPGDASPDTIAFPGPRDGTAAEAQRRPDQNLQTHQRGEF